MRILDICFKDVAQSLGDRRALLFLVLMPVVFTLFMGFAYRSGVQGEEESLRLALGWASADQDGALSLALHDMLAALDGITLIPLDQAGDSPAVVELAQDAVRSGDVVGAVLVPSGYSERESDGRKQQVTLIVDQGTAEGRTLVQALRGPISRVESAAEIARLAVETNPDEAAYNRALQEALDAWSGTDTSALVTVQGERDSEAFWYGDNPYNTASPGILVQFAIMSLVSSANILLAERKARTLERMMTTSLKRWQILVGHALGMVAVTLLQIVLLVLFGQLVLGVDYLRAPGATLLVSVALSLWIAGLGLTIGVLARDDSQVVLFALLAMFIFSALGGTWFPLDLVGGAFAAIGRALPSGLAMTGYQNVLLRGLGIASVGRPVLALLAWALGFGGLAWGVFRRQV